MPHDYKIDEQQQVVLARYWGVLSDEELAAHQAELRGDPRFHPGISHIFDARDVTDVAVSQEFMKQLGVSTLFAPAAKRACVVAQNVLYGLARMYEQQQSARGAESIRVFRDRSVALAWLGVNDSDRPRETTGQT